jgi:hypothetical protein
LTCDYFTKVFTADDPDKLSKKINDFLEEIGPFEYTHFHFSTSFGLGSGYLYDRFSVLIIFKERN